jgi:hypothetical protein
MTQLRFTGYRPVPPIDYLKNGTAAPPDEPQYEGTVFTDGSVSLRWRTEYRSTSNWDCWSDFEHVHGHPEYGTYIVFHDGVPEGVNPELIKADEAATRSIAFEVSDEMRERTPPIIGGDELFDDDQPSGLALTAGHNTMDPAKCRCGPHQVGTMWIHR